MKKSMVEYASALSDNKFDILKELIQKKYKKFVYLYWLLKDFSDNIAQLKYKNSSHELLKIEVKISGLNIDDVMNTLMDQVEEEESVLIWNEKNRIHIEITKDEKASDKE